MKGLSSIIEEVNRITPRTETERQLLSAVEILLEVVYVQKKEIQELRDEINRLKGEKGKPDIKPNTKSKDISSERERKEKTTWTKQSKKEHIEIDEEIPCPIDKSILPKDAIFKGYRKVISQDVELKRKNIAYLLELYYSPKEQKTYSSRLPEGYSGYFGANLRSLAYSLIYICDVTGHRLLKFFDSLGISISAGSLSNIFFEEEETFTQERQEILLSGLKTEYQQIDNTGTREKGMNLFTHVICNEYFTTFFTAENKKRISILKILQMKLGQEIKCIYNKTALGLLRKICVPLEAIDLISREIEKGKIYGNIELEKLIENIIGLKNKEYLKSRIIDAMAIAYYRLQKKVPQVKNLITDDAFEYANLVTRQALCWVHDARNYKKLMPFLEIYKDDYLKFMDRYWKYYRRLLRYRKKPSEALRGRLEKEFDMIFSKHTDYEELNYRIEKTMSHKDKLLLVLQHPKIPLHNNLAEIALRRIVRKRDISLHTMSKAGTTLRDSVLSVIETAGKLNVSAYEYLADRIKGIYKMPSLASLIPA